jgi:hypothetical protein
MMLILLIVVDLSRFGTLHMGQKGNYSNRITAQTLV